MSYVFLLFLTSISFLFIVFIPIFLAQYKKKTNLNF